MDIIKIRLIWLTILSIFSCTLILPLSQTQTVDALSGSQFQSGRIMDDSIFFANGTMTVSEIQDFLNSKVPTCDTYHARSSSPNDSGPPYICLKDYRQDIPTKAADAYCSGAIGAGSNISSAQIIYEVSRACNVNAKVLLVLLQKEQSLITDTWPWAIQYRSATGYGCPDTAPCDAEYYGFFNQVYNASRQFQRYVKQANLFNYRVGATSFVAYQANNPGCGGSDITMQTQATAALYNYTPYQPNAAALNNLGGSGDGCSAYGNRNFWVYYSNWFGSTLNGKCLNGYESNSGISAINFRKVNRNFDNGNYTIYNGGQSGCIETHIWNSNFSGWVSNNASNQAWVNPSDNIIKFADLDGDGIDEAILILLKNTPSGMVEFHVWKSDMKTWIVKTASNLPTSALNGVAIEFADLNGDGKDEPIAFGYTGTSTGMVEFHIWGNSVKEWGNHVVSNLPVIDPMKMQIGFSNFDGTGADEAVAFGISNTASEKLEFHLWQPGLASWRSHHISNLGVIDANKSSIYFADLDGNGVDSAILVHNRGTLSGKVEMHVWKSSLTDWESHNASNIFAAP